MMRKMLMVVLAIGLVGWLGSAVWAETPSSYKVTLYKTELSSDNGATWVTVLDNTSGQTVDLVTGAGSAFGQGAVPFGTYNMIKFTIQNSIVWSWGTTATNVAFPPYAGLTTDQVQVYFATTGNFSWSNNGESIAKAFPLPAAIVVSSDATSKIIMNFGVVGSLYQVSGTWYLNPPVISVSCIKVQTGAGAPAPFAGGPYYFTRQNIRIPADAALTITPTQISMESGWGLITMTPSATDPSLGTFEIAVGNDSYHYRYLGYSGSYAYAGGAIESGTEPMTGTYYVDADGYINMLVPDSGIIRGAVRDDDRVFIAIEISTPMSQTAYDDVGYHMIYAIKKETSTPGPVIGDYLYNGYQTEIQTAIDSATLAPRPDKYSLRYRLNVGFYRSTATTGASCDTSNRIDVSCPLSPTAQTVAPPTIKDEGPNTDTGLSIDADSKWVGMNEMWGASLNDGTVSIIAGSIIEPWEQWNDFGITYTNNSTSFFLALKPATIGVTPTVTGTYTMVYKGDSWETSMGNQLPANRVLLGNVTLDASNNVSGRFTRCEHQQAAGDDVYLQ
ncbi:MAG: hypothetical protein HY762_06710 [Planctomycetes bacterium]|nr:hypothetical protein [Planctomycetota bacterium]